MQEARGETQDARRGKAIRTEVQTLANKNKLFYCLECGKCTSVCPMAELFEDFSYEVSPRGIVEKTLLEYDVVNDPSIWYCVTCDVCTDGCPSGVRLRDFVESLRLLAIEEGVREAGLFCRRCGNYFLPTHTLEYLREMIGEGRVPLDFLNLCHRCRRYSLSEVVKENLPGSKRVRRMPDASLRPALQSRPSSRGTQDPREGLQDRGKGLRIRGKLRPRGSQMSEGSGL